MFSIILGIAVSVLTVCIWVKFFSSPSTPSINIKNPSNQQNNKANTNSSPTNSSSSNGNSSAPAAVKMTIFFGSQSGTAETFSNELSEEARMYGFQAKVMDLEEYDKDDLKDETFAVFLMATFGEGEPTDNATEFIEWAKSPDRQMGEELKGLPYAVFGLGNRQYEHFCAIGRFVDSRLSELGGVRVVEKGEGDDDGSLEDDFSQWKKDFWAAANKHFGTKANDAELKANESKKFISSYSVILVEGESKYSGGLSNLLTDPKHRVVKAKVIENRELRKYTEDGGSTRHIEFDLSGLKLSYVTADNLGVYPRNPPDIADSLCKILNFQPNQLFKTKAKPGKKSPFPSPCSINDAFLWYLDIQSSPRLPQLAILSQYATDEKEKAILHTWAHEGKDDYVSDHKTWIEIFDELKSCRPPLADLLDFIPKMLPRYYTISSSSLVSPSKCSVTVALMTHKKARGRVTQGIASSYLRQLEPSKDLAAIFIRPSSFRFPKPRLADKTNDATASPAVTYHSQQPPIVMIGPGTGLAPFRGFLQEISHLRAKGTPVGDVWLFFGCREESKDFIYSDELQRAAEEKHVEKLLIAFSRQQGKPKIYVQNLMEENSKDLWRKMNDEKGFIFICGGTQMGRAIREMIISIGQKHGGLTQPQAEEFIKKMQTEKRFIQELWS